MGYYENQQKKYKTRLEDILNKYPEQIQQQEQNSRNLLNNSDIQKQQGLNDILGGVSSTYGLSPSIINAGNSYQSEINPRINRARESLLMRQKISNLNDSYTKNYNYALENYKNAGYNLQQSVEFARQWAKQQSEQEFNASINQQNRDYTTQKDAISQEFQNSKNSINPDLGNPYEQALIRSIVGLAPYAGYAAYQKYSSNKNNNLNNYDTPYTTQTDYAYGPGQNLGYYPQPPTGGFRY